MIISPFDCETRSEVDLNACGRWPYMHGIHADIICITYREQFNSLTKIWRPGLEIPYIFKTKDQPFYMAHNIGFDWLVVNVLGKRYGFRSIPTEKCIDVMGIAARYNLPQSLDKLGQALGVVLGKMKEGKALKELLCVPPFRDPKKDDRWNYQKLMEFYAYCIRDVDSMCEIVTKLPSSILSADEQDIWHRIFGMNNQGAPIDYESVVCISNYIDSYLEKGTKALPRHTNGKVTTVHQNKRIIEFAASLGYTLPNMQEPTVTQAIEELEKGVQHCTPLVKVLKLRQLLGGAAIKKYKRLLNMTFNGRIMDNMKYYGANTGRVTGGGFQFLNLPRAKTDDPDILISKFKDGSISNFPDPMEEAKKLIRSMVKAEEGRVILAADWASIEYILLMWDAGEKDKVEAFRNGADPYKLFAVDLFKVPYEEVTDDQRQKSKPPVLGSGYMLGGPGLVEYAKGYGVELELEEAVYTTNLWRSKHPFVVNHWSNLKNAALNAVRYPRREFFIKNSSFQVLPDRTGREWLISKLPSGRKVFYCQPKLYESVYGPAIKHLGVDPISKQWTTVYLKPQRIIENRIQALGRDILEPAVKRLQQKGFNPFVTVYDEIVCHEPEDYCNIRLQEMCKIMSMSPEWGPDLPLRAEGYVSERYKKN